MIIKEPANIKTAPSRKYKFKLVLKIKKLKSITKNGYAISKIEAMDAPSILIPEKIKKFANVARTTERKISPRLSFPDPSKTFIDYESKSSIGKVIIAMSTESIKSKDNGETLSKIFWSIVYTKPQVTAAAMAYINPTVFIRIERISSPQIEIWFEPMFFSGFFCGFERCGSLRLRSVQAAAFPNFCGGIFSEKCVRTNSRILHQKGKVKEFWFGPLPPPPA